MSKFEDWIKRNVWKGATLLVMISVGYKTLKREAASSKPFKEKIEEFAGTIKRPATKELVEPAKPKAPSVKSGIIPISNDYKTLDEIFTREESGNKDYIVSAKQKGKYYFGRYQFNSQHVKKFCDYAASRPEYKSIADSLSTSQGKKIKLDEKYIDTEAFTAVWKKTAKEHANFGQATIDYAQDGYFPKYFEDLKEKLSQDATLSKAIRYMDLDKVDPAVIASWKSAMIQHREYYVPISRSLQGLTSVSEVNTPEYIEKLYEHRNQRTDKKYKTRYEREAKNMSEKLGMFTAEKGQFEKLIEGKTTAQAKQIERKKNSERIAAGTPKKLPKKVIAAHIMRAKNSRYS